MIPNQTAVVLKRQKEKSPIEPRKAFNPTKLHAFDQSGN
jgi:hypothetical protein